MHCLVCLGFPGVLPLPGVTYDVTFLWKWFGTCDTFLIHGIWEVIFICMKTERQSYLNFLINHKVSSISEMKILRCKYCQCFLLDSWKNSDSKNSCQSATGVGGPGLRDWQSDWSSSGTFMSTMVPHLSSLSPLVYYSWTITHLSCPDSVTQEPHNKGERIQQL